MTVITEIAPDTYRISIYMRAGDLQFNHMLVVDDEPLLFATGTRAMFPQMREAVAMLIDPARLRWIGFGHFEGDECGALNEWLALAPAAQPLCGVLGAVLSIDDFALRPARMLAPNEVLATGKYRYRFCPTPHLPHGWDSGMLFEETERTLLCSDLFFHHGNVEPLTEGDLVERARAALLHHQSGPLTDSIPYTAQTKRLLDGLAALQPRTLATAHGSSFTGDGARALRELHQVLWETFGAVSEMPLHPRPEVALPNRHVHSSANRSAAQAWGGPDELS
jgi:flavorubredoxin